jgi:biotin carboxyl carrier protein
MVNNNLYDIEILDSGNFKVNGKEISVISHDDYITLEGTEFRLDFEEEGEPSLMIINGMSYLVSKNSDTERTFSKVKAPISGRIIEIPVEKGTKVRQGQVMIVIEAMKMENEIKSPTSKWIKDILVSKGQSVKKGDILITFDIAKNKLFG